MCGSVAFGSAFTALPAVLALPDKYAPPRAAGRPRRLLVPEVSVVTAELARRWSAPVTAVPVNRAGL
jgi:hypothetical protein